MMFLITFLRPYVDERIDWVKIEQLREHYMSLYSNLRIHRWYEAYKDDPNYWENWDGKHIIVRIKAGKSFPHILKGYAYRKLRYSPSYLVEIPESKRNKSYVKSLLDQLNSDPSVEYAEPNLIYKISYWPNDPYLGTDLWGMWVIYADKAWDITVGNGSVKVCVVDQGVDYLHEDLAGNYGYGKDMVQGDNDPYPVSPMEFHGTHVAGTIAGVMNNGKGVVGVSQSLILSCRALNDSGTGSTADVAQCIRWCADTGANVINMSLGGSMPASELESAVNYAVDTQGVVVVAASGNDGASSVNFPAAYDASIAVGALDTSGSKAYFSNYGPELDVVAPGVFILSTVPFTNQYQYLDGTSMATPHVSGVVALILSKNPNLSPADVRSIINGTAIDMGEIGKDWFYGYGLVNAYRALLATPSPTLASSHKYDGLNLRISKGSVYIESDKVFSIYDVKGANIFTGKRFKGKLKEGAYFVSFGRKVRKLIVW